MHPTAKECIHGDDLNSDENSEESCALAIISDNNEDSEPEVNIAIYNNVSIKKPFAFINAE